MNLKLNGFIGITCLLLGIYLGTKIGPKPNAVVPPQIAQDQSQKCKAVVSKVTTKDGSVTESVAFEADSSQKQEVKPLEVPAALGISAALFSDKQFNLGYKIGEIEILSLKFETEIIGKIENINNINSQKDIGVGLRF